MKKSLLSALAMVTLCSFCFGMEKTMLIPYEFANRKGFVNEKLERVAMPVYSTSDRGNHGSPYTKHAAIATRELVHRFLNSNINMKFRILPDFF